MASGFPGQFVASLDGRWLCVSPEPLLASARMLLAEGVDPETRIAIRHAGTNSDAMFSTVGVAAALTVREGNKAGPALVHWKPFPTSPVRPSMRQNERPVPTVPDAERISDGRPAL